MDTHPLPKYILDKEPGQDHKIWNTVDHEYTDDEPIHNKADAAARVQELNEG